jgi:stage II sporulation protein D
MNGFIPYPGRPGIRRRLAVAAAMTCAAALGFLLTSCHQRASPSAGTAGRLAPAAAGPAVPTVRVCLCPAPVERTVISTTGGYVLQLDGRDAFSSRMPLDRGQVLLQGGRWFLNALELGTGMLGILPTDGVVQHERTTYRGSLRFVPAEAGGFLVVNHVDLEGYLAGVLAQELYPSWSPAAYEALAVAARTYAIYQMKTLGRGRAFDLGSDDGSQVYGGFTAETPKSRQAVQRTFAQVLVCRHGGRRQVFKAQYSACCGGRTNPAEILRDAPRVQPLSGGQACEDCIGCRFYRWGTLRLPKAEVYQALAGMFPGTRQLGGIRWIQVESATSTGRPVWVTVYGKSGFGLQLRAEDLRVALLRSGQPAMPRLPSMNCRIVDAGDFLEFSEGRGFGHGVGLCQWGAQGKALKGWDYRRILDFYYPSSSVIQAY